MVDYVNSLYPRRSSFDTGPPMALRKAYSHAAGGHGVGRGKLGMKSQLRVKNHISKNAGRDVNDFLKCPFFRDVLT